MIQGYIATGTVIALIIAYNVFGATKVQQGVQQERARVDIEAGQKNAKAQAARRAITPDTADSVLGKYYRD